MKPLFFILCCLILSLSQIQAQAPQYHWMNQLGGVGNEIGGYVTVDGNGNVYSASGIYANASFKPNSPKEVKYIKTSASTGFNFILTKVDAVGNLIWSKQFGGNVSPYTITTDKSNNVIIAGAFFNTVDFDPSVAVFNLTSKDAGDIFILKLDENGNFVWAGRMGGKNGDYPLSLAADKFDNIGLICFFRDTIDVDMSSSVYNLIPTSSIESAVIKFSPSGNFIWAHHLNDINPNAISFDSSGNLYSTGYFLTTKDFDFGTGVFNMTSTGSSGSADAYLLKEDTAGKFMWAKSFGEFVNRDYPDCITVDKNDNVLVAGSCGAGNSDFDPGPGVINLVGNSQFILKLDNLGNYIWAKGINQGTSIFKYWAIKTDDSNQVYTCGNFTGSIDFDPGIGLATLSSVASTDGFILKLDSNGTFGWVNQLMCSGSINSTSMYVSGNGNLYLGGDFTLKTDFDPGLGTKIDSAVGGTDVFTLKISRCLLNNSISLNECKYFDYAGHRFDSSELIDVLFVTAAGCDSVVTVDMMVKTVNDTISAAGSVITAKSTTATSYQWVNCPAYVAVPGATSMSFTATLSGSYALIITENGCTDTSDCVAVKGLSIQESHTKAFISISPNPSKGIFHLTMPAEMKSVVEIRSIEGRILQTHTLSSTEETIDLSSYASGVYFIEVKTKEGFHQVEKLIKY